MSEALVVWWNVQRLFRPDSSAIARALDATPLAGWTATAYRRKIRALAAVLTHVCEGEVPVLVALAEVEDARCARALLDAAGLDPLIIVEDPAARLAGDDLVLAYDPSRLATDGAPESFNIHNRFTTRDMYRAPFQTSGGAQLLVVTNHWPSRLISNSPSLRIGLGDYCGRMVEGHLKLAKDDLIGKDGRARLPARSTLLARAARAVLLLGDFNDEPPDASIVEALGASRTAPRKGANPRFPSTNSMRSVNAYLSTRIPLYNPSWELMVGAGPTGTTYWNAGWYLLDQALVSPGLATGGPISYVPHSLRLHAPRTVSSPRGGEQIRPTTRNGTPLAFDPKTGGGVSDHLPLTLRLDI